MVCPCLESGLCLLFQVSARDVRCPVRGDSTGTVHSQHCPGKAQGHSVIRGHCLVWCGHWPLNNWWTLVLGTDMDSHQWTSLFESLTLCHLCDSISGDECMCDTYTCCKLAMLPKYSTMLTGFTRMFTRITTVFIKGNISIYLPNFYYLCQINVRWRVTLCFATWPLWEIIHLRH